MTSAELIREHKLASYAFREHGDDTFLYNGIFDLEVRADRWRRQASMTWWICAALTSALLWKLIYWCLADLWRLMR